MAADPLYAQLTSALTSAIAGKDLVLALYNSTTFSLLAVAGQQGLTINRDKDTFEVTSKNSNGWKEFIGGLNEWSIDNDGIYVRSDETHTALKDAYASGEPILIKVVNIKASKDLFGGLAILNSYPIEAPYDDAVTYTIGLQGTGELVDLADAASTITP